MPLLTASGIEKHYGTQVCFEDAKFELNEGARVGLIGANGTGKTTLMAIILGTTDFHGMLSKKKDLRIATLDQDPKFEPGTTVRDAVLAGCANVVELEHGMRDIHERLAHESLSPDDMTKLLEKLGNMEAEFEHLGGYALENRADRILEGLGFPKARHEAAVETLSGGERNRVAFGQLLMVEPDLWLLDEPTNHLDLDGILFLEETLSESKAAAVIISHDRRFLDDTTTETWEIENHKLNTYGGAYSRARELRQERIKAGQRAFDKQYADIEKQAAFIRRYQAGQRARQAAGRAKRLDRVERLVRPEDRARAVDLEFPIGEKPGRKILKVRDVAMGYGDRRLFEHLEFEIEAGETLGIMGPNGAGKTTLFKALQKELAPLEGEIFWGERVRAGSLSQHEVFDAPDLTPFKFLRGIDKHKTDLKLRSLLAAMLFRADEIDKPVTVLSGGERKRLMLTRLLLEGHNVLLLDEPTNHLDLPSREALELALSVYEGTLLVVSHDRHFLDLVADRILWIENGEWRLTEGGYREAQAARKKVMDARAKIKPAAPQGTFIPPPAAVAPPAPTSLLGRLKTPELEAKIVKLEDEIAMINKRFADPEVFLKPEKMKDLQIRMEMAKRDLVELEAEYATRRA